MSLLSKKKKCFSRPEISKSYCMLVKSNKIVYFFSVCILSWLWNVSRKQISHPCLPLGWKRGGGFLVNSCHVVKVQIVCPWKIFSEWFFKYACVACTWITGGRETVPFDVWSLSLSVTSWMYLCHILHSLLSFIFLYFCFFLFSLNLFLVPSLPPFSNWSQSRAWMTIVVHRVLYSILCFWKLDDYYIFSSL